MFDPTKLISVEEMLVTEWYKSLDSVKINKDNTVVTEVIPQTSGRFNTLAVVDTVDARGAVVRRDRDINYNRVDISEVIGKYAPVVTDSTGISTHQLLSNVVTAPVRYATPAILAQALAEAYGANVVESDFFTVVRPGVTITETILGEAYNVVNFTADGDKLRYTAGKVMVVDPISGDGGDIDLGMVDGAELYTASAFGEKLTITLPAAKDAANMRIVLAQVTNLTVTKAKAIMLSAVADSANNEWRFDAGSDPWVGDRVSDTTEGGPTISIHSVDGYYHVTMTPNGGEPVDRVSTKVFAKTDIDLVRLQTYHVEKPVAYDLGAKRENVLGDNPAGHKTPTAVYNETTDFLGEKRVAHQAGYAINSFTPDGNAYAFSMTTYDLGDVPEFDITVSNVVDGNYISLGQATTFVGIAESGQEVEAFKNLLETHFVSQYKIAGLGFTATKTSSEAQSLSTNGESATLGVLDPTTIESIALSYRSGETRTLTGEINHLDAETDSIVSDPWVFADPNQTPTMDFTSKLAQIINPVVFVVHGVSGNKADALKYMKYSSSALPLAESEMGYLEPVIGIKANADSTAVTGELKYPVQVVNALTVGYKIDDAGRFIGLPKSGLNFGGCRIEKTFVFDGNHFVEMTFTIEKLAALLNSLGTTGLQLRVHEIGDDNQLVIGTEYTYMLTISSKDSHQLQIRDANYNLVAMTTITNWVETDNVAIMLVTDPLTKQMYFADSSDYASRYINPQFNTVDVNQAKAQRKRYKVVLELSLDASAVAPTVEISLSKSHIDGGGIM